MELPVVFLNPAKKYLKKIKEKPLKEAFYQAIQEIRSNPYKGELKTGDLAGIYGYDVNYRGTNYEIAYRIEENEKGEIVVIILAGTREEFYQALKKYIN